MVTKNFIKTIVAGLLERIKTHEISEKELIELISEMDVIKPLANNEDAVYTNTDGKVYIL